MCCCAFITRLLLLVIVAGIFVNTGLCQNAEPSGRRFKDFRNSPVATDYDSRRDDTWETRPEGATRPDSEEEKEEKKEEEEELSSREDEIARAATYTGSEGATSLISPSHGKSSHELQSQRTINSNSRQLQSDRRRKKRRRGRQQQQQKQQQQQQQQQQQPAWKNFDVDRENLVNLGGRFRGKKKDIADPSSVTNLSVSEKKTRSRASKFREERRRRRRNRKRTRSRIRLENRREDRKWRENPIVRLIKILNEQKMDEAKLLSDNPLNLSTTRINSDVETTRILDIANVTSSSSSQLAQLTTTESRIPMPPEPTSRFRIQPGDVEREFSRQVEREYTRAQQQAERVSDEENDGKEEEEEEEEQEEEEEENEELPRFDEKYAQVAKQPEDLVRAPFDPERMLGYSRTDEDLPILDMENEVLQRTIKDYNAYMSSSYPKAAQIARNQDKQQSFDRKKFYFDLSSSSTETVSTLSENDDDLRGDLSCINGSFVPAPYLQHAVIKYVKSTSPDQEYLEADYECESGYVMLSNNSRLLCHNRRWIGKLPICKYRADDEATCSKLGCEQLCRIVAGKAECLCREGYRLEDRKCTDIDECLINEGHGPCEDKCHNVAGSYYCTCENQPRSTLASDNHTCQDNPTISNQEEVDGGLCDYDNAGCSHTCLASMGRVFCLCPDGFMLEDDWKTCQDVDECAVPDLQTDVCRWGCVNTPGSYRCKQPPAQVSVQDLVQAAVLSKKSDCQLGYEATTVTSCVDINECSISNGGCAEVCENTEGSFFCACEGDERILAADRRTCVVAEKRFESMDRKTAELSLRFRVVSCSPLNPAGRGQLICSGNEPNTTTEEYESMIDKDDEKKDVNENVGDDIEEDEIERMKPGTKCHLKCPHGYELHGEYELTCLADGTWDGPKHGECVQYSKPRLDCPKSVVAELPAGRDEAFVTYDQPSTDLDWFRYVRSKPSWGTRLEANLKKGEHEITFYARHPVSKKQASCILKINVEEGQAPKVKGCPSDIEITGKNGSAITWVEPVFTDNVKVTRITSNESPGHTFSIGGHKVEYEATDEAGWTTKCTFTVVLRPLSD